MNQLWLPSLEIRFHFSLVPVWSVPVTTHEVRLVSTESVAADAAASSALCRAGTTRTRLCFVTSEGSETLTSINIGESSARPSMEARIFAVLDSNGLKESSFKTPPSAKTTPGFFDVSVALVSVSVPVPLFRTVTSSVPTSPSSRMPSLSQLITSSLTVAATSVAALPTRKLSTTPRLSVLSRAGPIAPTPAPRFANAFQKS